MTKKPISEQVRRAIRESGLTRYAIAKTTGVDAATLCRFVHGQVGLSMPALDKVGEFLNLKIVVESKQAKKPKG